MNGPSLIKGNEISNKREDCRKQ